MLYSFLTSGNVSSFRYVNPNLNGRYKFRFVTTMASAFSSTLQNIFVIRSNQLYNPIGNSPLMFSPSKGTSNSSSCYNQVSRDNNEFIIDVAGVIEFTTAQSTIAQSGAGTAINNLIVYFDLEKII